MRKRTIAALAAVGLLFAAGTGTALAAPASAHTPTLSATCATGATIDATNYDPNARNLWLITINGKTTSGVFGASTHQSVPFPQNGTRSTYSLRIEAPGTAYDKSLRGTTEVCGIVPRDAVATISVTTPTCDAPGVATVTAVRATTESAALDQTVGTHSITYYTEPGHLFADGTATAVLQYTIPAATGYQSADPGAACFHRPEAPEPQVMVGTWVDQTGEPSCDVDTVATHRTTTTKPYTWNEDTHEWVVNTDESTWTVTDEDGTRPKTAEEVQACESTTPPTEEPTTPPVTTPPTDEPTEPAPTDEPTEPTPTDKPTEPATVPTPTAGTTPPATSPAAPSTPPKSSTTAVPVAADTSRGTLAYTGSDAILPGSIAALALLALGGFLLHRRHAARREAIRTSNDR